MKTMGLKRWEKLAALAGFICLAIGLGFFGRMVFAPPKPPALQIAPEAAQDDIDEEGQEARAEAQAEIPRQEKGRHGRRPRHRGQRRL